jgi:hypothetical protein
MYTHTYPHISPYNTPPQSCACHRNEDVDDDNSTNASPLSEQRSPSGLSPSPPNAPATSRRSLAPSPTTPSLSQTLMPPQPSLSSSSSAASASAAASSSSSSTAVNPSQVNPSLRSGTVAITVTDSTPPQARATLFQNTRVQQQQQAERQQFQRGPHPQLHSSGLGGRGAMMNDDGNADRSSDRVGWVISRDGGNDHQFVLVDVLLHETASRVFIATFPCTTTTTVQTLPCRGVRLISTQCSFFVPHHHNYLAFSTSRWVCFNRVLLFVTNFQSFLFTTFNRPSHCTQMRIWRPSELPVPDSCTAPTRTRFHRTSASTARPHALLWCLTTLRPRRGGCGRGLCGCWVALQQARLLPSQHPQHLTLSSSRCEAHTVLSEPSISTPLSLVCI